MVNLSLRKVTATRPSSALTCKSFAVAVIAVRHMNKKTGTKMVPLRPYCSLRLLHNSGPKMYPAMNSETPRTVTCRPTLNCSEMYGEAEEKTEDANVEHMVVVPKSMVIKTLRVYDQFFGLAGSSTLSNVTCPVF